MLQIHDELVYEVREDVANKFLEIMQKTMTAALNLSVPLTLSVYVALIGVHLLMCSTIQKNRKDVGFNETIQYNY